MKKSNRSLRFVPSDPVESEAPATAAPVGSYGGGGGDGYINGLGSRQHQQSLHGQHGYGSCETESGETLCLSLHPPPMNPLVFHLQQELPFHLHPVKSYKPDLLYHQQQEVRTQERTATTAHRSQKQQLLHQPQVPHRHPSISSQFLGSDLRLLPTRRDQQRHQQQQSHERKKYQYQQQPYQWQHGSQGNSLGTTQRAGYTTSSSYAESPECMAHWREVDEEKKRENHRERKERERRRNANEPGPRSESRSEKKGRRKVAATSDVSNSLGLSIRDKETTALRAIYCTLLQGVDYYYAKSHAHPNNNNNYNHPHQLSTWATTTPATTAAEGSGKSHHLSSSASSSGSSKDCMEGSCWRPSDAVTSLAPLTTTTAAAGINNNRTYTHGNGNMFTRPSLPSSPSSSSSTSSSSSSSSSSSTSSTSSSGSLVSHYNDNGKTGNSKKYGNISISINNNINNHGDHFGNGNGNGIGNTLGMGVSNCWASATATAGPSLGEESYTPPSPSSPSLGYHLMHPLTTLHHQHHLQSCLSTDGGEDGASFFFPGPSVDDVIDSLEAVELTTPEPPARPWITMASPIRDKPSCLFTVMSYNILCDKYATRQLYGYCPNWALIWEYRRKSIIDEIKTYAADIICLQEVETEQFYCYFLPELTRDGYEGIFSPKSRAKTMSENDRKHVDGLAIFYRKVKFSLIKKHLVEFNQMAMSNADGCDDMLNRVMTKDDIGLVALLQTRDEAFDERNFAPDSHQVNQQLLVCTTHIHWDPEYCDVKLIQTMMLMHELRKIAEDSVTRFRRGGDPNTVPLLFCSDLNSLPNSGVIEFLSTGRVAADHPDFKELGYQECLKRLSSTENKDQFTHPFQIARAYNDDVIPFTNFTRVSSIHE